MRLNTKIVLSVLAILACAVIAYAQLSAPAPPTGLKIISSQNEYGKVTYGPKQNQLSVVLFNRD